MRWIIKHGDILDEPADVLICSANVFLNLSGGVGGAILLRYGRSMQDELHRFLTDRQRAHAELGDVVMTSPCDTPYRAVLHAVAVDGFYRSSPEVISRVVTRSLQLAASQGAQRVALTALATGFGRLSFGQFAAGIKPLLIQAFPPIDEVVVCLRSDHDRQELTSLLRDEDRKTLP